jgi:hypothetical protein
LESAPPDATHWSTRGLVLLAVTPGVLREPNDHEGHGPGLPSRSSPSLREITLTGTGASILVAPKVPSMTSTSAVASPFLSDPLKPPPQPLPWGAALLE